MLFKNSKIPIWINVLQVLLTVIMFQQAYIYFFDHESLISAGIDINGTSQLNLIYEFASRTLVMAIISIFVLITQNPRYFLVVLLMNIFREGSETIIDPMFPLANAPMTPAADLIAHIVIVLIEILAFMKIFKIVKEMNNREN